MTIFADYAEARESLTANKWGYTEWDKEKKVPVAATLADINSYLDDFARIAAFLCNPGRFQDALANVSALIWSVYAGLDPDIRNRFTRALGVVAVDSGFTFQDRMTLDTSDTAPIGVLLIGNDSQLGYMLRHKLFWKDGMDSRHGEHTHSLQWLAISLGAGTTKLAADLYAKAGDLRAPSKSDAKGVRSLTMWQWIADCFPSDLKKAATKEFMNGETLESQSGRSPQVIMDSLLKGQPQDHRAQFLAAYLFRRYRNRGWLEFEYDETNTRQVKDIQTTAINTHGAGDRAAHGWVQSPSSPTARMIRDKDNYAAKGTQTTDPKKQFKVKFHNLKGTLSYHY
jgi:hypothetical protein